MISASINTKRLRRIYLRSIFLTMFGSIALFALSDLTLSFFIIGLVGISIGYWYAAQGPSTISRLAINALLTVVIVLGFTNALRGNFSVSSFAFFSLLLMILKLFDLRTPRDHGQILVLSLSLVIAAALTSNSMPVGLGVFIMGFILIRALMLFRLFALTCISDQPTHFDPTASTDLRSIQTITGFVCVIVALLIFLVMPRSLGNNSLGQWGGAGTASLTTGFADDVELGRSGRITDSPTPVLRVSITDRNDQPVGSDNSKAIYLRGSVLTQYNSGRWVAHSDQSIPTTFRTRIVQQDQSIPIVDDNSRADWAHEYNITFDRKDQNYGYLFTPWKPLELRPTTNQARVGVDPDTRMILLASKPVNAYRVRATDPEFQRPLPFLKRSSDPIDHTGITPNIARLANQILTQARIDPDPRSRPATDDFKAVRAIENHLRSQYKYTLVSEPVPPNRDATDWFLFDRKEGHCEYYASSLTLMTRSVGIHARVITGYVAAEYNDVTGSYTVRESNAHAWVEAMIAPDFWRTFDGTPQSDFHSIHEPEPSIVRSIAKFYEAFEHAWVTIVVGYDSDDRDTVFGNINPDFGLESVAVNLQNRIAAGRSRLLKKALITAGLIFSITTILGIALIFFANTPIFAALKDRLTRIAAYALNPIRKSKSQTEHTATQLIAQVHAHLHAQNAPCPVGRPLRLHIDSLDPLSHTLLSDAADLLYQLRFAPANESFQSEFLNKAHTLTTQLRSVR